VIGYVTVAPVVFGDFFHGSIYVAPEHDVLHHLAGEFHGPAAFAAHGLLVPPFWLVVAGFASAWYIYLRRPERADQLRQRFALLYGILVRKYGFDEFYQAVFATGSRRLGQGLWRYADAGLIDGLLVNGAARLVGWVAAVTRQVQFGYLYHYAFAMILRLL